MTISSEPVPPWSTAGGKENSRTFTAWNLAWNALTPRGLGYNANRMIAAAGLQYFSGGTGAGSKSKTKKK